MSYAFEYDGLPLIETTGGTLKGYRFDHIYTYKGIPYAHAKRWQMATPATWEGVFDATNYGRVAPLMMEDNPKGELKCPHMYWPQDEDCLSLNIWTKDLIKKKPVMVWIHGGGYFAGSSIEQLAYDGANLAKEEVVVVSLNHRLNILGFLDLEPFGERFKNSANCGLDDIVVALRWIKENIASFGGDPENVTLFGQSGGGMKISLLMQITAAEGLFHKAVMMSGIGGDFMPPCPKENSDGTMIVTKMLEALNLSVNEIEQLETMPYQQVFQAYAKAMPQVAAVGGYVGNNPRIDTYCLGEAHKVGFSKQALRTPVLIGSVFGEFAGFAPLPFHKYELPEATQREMLKERYHEATEEIITLFQKAYPDKALADLLVIDTLFRPLKKEFVNAKAAHPESAVYNYLFALDFPMDGGSAAWHCSDIPFFFHNIDKAPYANIEEVSDRLQNQMSKALIQFAYCGDPNHEGLPQWEAAKPGKETTMVFDQTCRCVQELDTALLNKIAEVTPKLTFQQLMQMMGETNIQH